MRDGNQLLVVAVLLLFSVVGGLVAAGLFGGTLFPYKPEHAGFHTIRVGGVPLSVELARSQAEHERGLSGREFLPYDHGMLFVFDTPAFYRIWMKNMIIPIDVFWIAADGAIVDLWEEAQPESYPYIFEPQSEALFILEAPAGFARVYNIKKGTLVTNLQGLVASE